MTEKTLIPVTVLTGYLGAGKTTLLNRILSEDHGHRYAVIVNEFGEIGIDNELILNTDEELFEMNNGCICCTVRGDLIRTLHGLLAKGGNFDAIVVETTGLADPGPVAQTFFVDGYLRSKTELDSVTTVVDAKHLPLRLADSREAVEQIAFADQIVLNKTDLVSEIELKEIETRLKRMNPLAPIHRAQRDAAHRPPQDRALADHALPREGPRHFARQGYHRCEGQPAPAGVPGGAHDPGGRSPARMARGRDALLAHGVH